MTLTIGSLFSGIGGLELGLERAGLGPVAFQVEREPYCRAVLAKHWPDALRFDDVCTAGAHNLPPVDVLCGGFPCQPHSVAGKREGSEDERDLWPEYARLIRELRPRYVVAENVPGLLTSDGGRFYNRVLSDLAAIGYDVEWDVLSAADVGAPQLRERLFTIARNAVADTRCRGNEHHSGRRDASRATSALESEAQERKRGGRHSRNCNAVVGDASGIGRPPRLSGPNAGDEGLAGIDHNGSDVVGRHAAARSAVGHADRERRRGESQWAGIEGASRRESGRPEPLVSPWADGVAVRGADGTVRIIPRSAAEGGPESPLWPVAHGIPGRVAQLRAIGNAVVPQVAEVVGRLILAREAAIASEAA